MKSARTLAVLLAASIAALALDAGAQQCKLQPSGPVSILILDSAQKVAEFAASVRDGRAVVREPGTVIFADGRVATSDVDAATRHLNGLGWGNRPLEVVASLRLRPAQAPGGG